MDFADSPEHAEFRSEGNIIGERGLGLPNG